MVGDENMKRYVPPVLLLFCALLCACASKWQTYLAPFDAAFETNIEGEYRGVTFSAKLVCEAACDGARPATLTFYAPSSLCGTVLARDNTGALTLSVGGVTLTAPNSYTALLDVFFVSRVGTVAREGVHTRVSGDGYSLLFAEDGTPLSVTNGEVTVRVLSFAQT